MEYRVIFRQNSAGELLGPFCLDTNHGRVVLIFSKQASFAEAMTYAQRSVVTPGFEVTMAIRSADSLDEFSQALDAFLHEAFPGWNASYVSEEDELFDDILTQLREQSTGQAFAEMDSGGTARRRLVLLPFGLRLSLQKGRDTTSQYEQRRDLPTLDEAIAAWEGTLRHPAFRLAPEATQFDAFSDLAFLRMQRHQKTADAQDLDRAIEGYSRAVALAAQASADRSYQLDGLGGALRIRYLNTGNPDDLEEAVKTHDLAAAESPPGSAAHARFLSNLAAALADRYQRTGDLRDLERIIAASEQALDETPAGPSRALRLNNLGAALWLQYRRAGDLGDLERVIQTYERALHEATPDSDVAATALANVGRSLWERHSRIGDPEDLERAINVLEQAVRQSESDAPERAGRLSSLGSALADRAERTGDLADLDRAVQIYEQAAADAPPGSPQYLTSLEALGTGLVARYDRTRDFSDLSRAIQVFEQVVADTGNNAPNRAARLSNLAAAWFKRYYRRGDADDLARAVDMFEQAASLHPRNAAYLGNLGAGLSVRYRRSPDRDDLDRAIDAFERAVAGSSSGSPQLPTYLSNLAASLLYRYELTSDPDDLGSVADAYRAACVEGARSDPETSLSAGRSWGDWAAGRQAWPEAADAYGFALEAADVLVRTQLTRTHKETWLRTARDLPPAAAYALARAGKAEAATVVLEQGRAYLLSEALRGSQVFAPPTFPDVADAAIRPLVYLAAARWGGLALIIGTNGIEAQVCWLPQLTSTTLTNRMERFRASYAQRARNEAAWRGTLDATLGWLWGAAMGPLLSALGPVPAATIIPCGHLGMLPLHAAWTKDDTLPSGRRYALDSITFSYAPNARALATAQALAGRVAPTALLAVDEPRPAKADPLPFSASEVAAACSYFDHSKVLRNEAATRAAVLEEFANYPVHHLSCHGRADLETPLQSALIMSGGEPLTLQDLLSLRLAEPPRPGSRLAVLSACETDMPGTELPDEVTSMSAGLLQAGLGGVIASQWAVRGGATAMLMTRFYAHWRNDGLDPGQALCQAQRWLRDSTNAEKVQFFGTAQRMTSRGRRGESSAAVGDLAQAVLLRPPAERMFLHPAAWAAFAHIGSLTLDRREAPCTHPKRSDGLPG